MSIELKFYVGNSKDPYMINEPILFRDVCQLMIDAFGFDGRKADRIIRSSDEYLSNGVRFFFKSIVKAAVELTEDILNNEVPINQSGKLFWKKTLKVYSYGTGAGVHPKVSNKKHYAILCFDSSLPEDLNRQLKKRDRSYECSTVKTFALSSADIPSLVFPASIHMIDFEQADRTLPVDPASASDFIFHDPSSVDGELLFYFGAKTLYSKLALNQVLKNVELPAIDSTVTGNNLFEKIVNRVTEQQQTMFEQRISEYVALIKTQGMNERWQSCVRLSFDYLFFLQPHLAVQADYNQATRRMIVNAVMLASCSYCGTTLNIEKTVWSSENSRKFENVCGFGPLDFFSDGAAVLSAMELFSSPLSLSYYEVTSSSSAVDEEPKTKAARVDSGPLPSSVCTYKELRPYTRVCMPLCVSLVPLSSRDIVHHYESTCKEEDVDGMNLKYGSCEEIEDDSCCSTKAYTAPPTVTLTNGEPEVSYPIDCEAKRHLIEAKSLQALIQLAGQMSDLHLKSESNDPKAAIVFPSVCGCLTSGETYHFFRSNWREGQPKSVLTYLGKLRLSVFMRPETSVDHTGGAKIYCDEQKYCRLSYEDFERVVGVTVMMMEGVLSSACHHL